MSHWVPRFYSPPVTTACECAFGSVTAIVVESRLKFLSKYGLLIRHIQVASLLLYYNIIEYFKFFRTVKVERSATEKEGTYEIAFILGQLIGLFWQVLSFMNEWHYCKLKTAPHNQ
jgi:hypothetical protein